MLVSFGRARRRLVVMTTVAGLAAIAMAAPASAAPPTVTTEVSHVQFSEHFDGNPNCGTVGGTEFFDGTQRLHVVTDGDTMHVTFGSTFDIVGVPDDPASLPSNVTPPMQRPSKSSTTEGSWSSMESFHDKNTVFGDLRFYTTFVAVDGVVKVDHTRSFPPGQPPPGC